MQAYRHPLITLFFALLSIALLLPAADARDQLVSRHQHARMIKLWGPPPAARRDLFDGLGLGGKKDDNASSTGAAGAAGAGNVAAAPTPSAGGSGSASAPGGTVSSPSAGAAAPTTPPGGTGASPSAPADPNNGSGAAPGGGNAGGNNNDNGGGLGGIVGSLSSGVGGIITGGNTPPPQQTPSATQSTPSVSPTDTASQSQTQSATQPLSTPVASVPPVSGVDSSPSQPTVDAPPETQSNAPVTTSLTPQQQQQDENETRISPTTQVILIAVGSSVVGAAIIWTLIRKWKFRASRNRLATIDWAPDNSGDNMEDRQRFSFISQRSASASGVDAQSQVRRNMFAPDAPLAAPDFPPPHDFTAGPVRGVTPQPGLQRGYSGNRGQYGY